MTKKLKPTDLKGFVDNVHQPYTDYNQEIMEWLEEHSDVTDFDKRDCKYIFCGKAAFYNHNVKYTYDVYYTNEQFMELIGMTKKEENTSGNTFTKADLKDGMICTTRNGIVVTVKGDRLLREGGMYINLSDVHEDLTVSDLGSLDIIKVEQPTVVFERVDLRQQATKKELELAEAKKQRLENHINILKSKLK